MATLGDTTTPGTQGGGAAGLVVLTPVTATEAGTITAINCYLATTGAANVKPLIYADSAGSPGALLATGSVIAFAGTSAAGWSTSSISYSFTNGQVLWIGSTQDASAAHTYSRAATGTTSFFKSGTTYATPPDPISAMTSDANKSYGFYLTYTATGGATSGSASGGVNYPTVFIIN